MKGGAVLTPEGEALHPLIERLVLAENDVQAAATAFARLTRGMVRIATFASVATVWLPAVIKAFKTKYPDVNCEILMGDYGEIDHWVKSGRVDFGFTSPEIEEGLESFLVKADEMVLAVHESHPFARMERVPVQLLNLPGRPKAIAETLGGAKNADGSIKEPGIFAAVPYCLDLIGGPFIETDETVIKAFRPKAKETPAPAPEPAAAAPVEAPTSPEEKPAAAPTVPEPPKAASAQDDRPHMSPEAIARRSVQRGVPLFNDRRQSAGPAPLRCFVKEPVDGSSPQCTVVWLHGMGTTVKDFEPFAREVADFGAPAARFVFPQAPKLALTAHRGWETTAWYDVLSDDFTSREDERGIRSMHLRVSQVIRELVAAGTLANRIFLGGFSMGAAMALYTGLRQPQPLAGVIALSGYLPLASTLPAEITPAGHLTPIFMGHGAFDDVINPLTAQAGAKLIETLAETLIWREYNMEHTLCPEEMTHIAQFMTAALHS